MKYLPSMNRILVERITRNEGLFYGGIEVVVKGDEVFAKNSGFKLTATKADLSLHNKEFDGIVLAVGPFVEERMGFPLKAGDHIRYGRNVNTITRIDNKECDVIQDVDIIVIVIKGEE